MKILVCDDEPIIREITSTMLRMHKHQVEIASDGQDALEKIQAEPFDVLITDFKMPRLNGIELIERLRAMESPLKVVLITGFADELDTETMEGLKLDGFLKKPFKKTEIIDCVNKIRDIANGVTRRDAKSWFSRKVVLK